ncbi:hypothetical protein ACJJIP_16485 [Microbulbifer sp. VTAC004]|uniref:DUF7673 family protein n=1 Tax=Microbulbifer sp. VTAC004 TaxID=3243386 RepID=UPI00403963E4
MSSFSPIQSVETLLTVANGYSGASAIAAQVLLSAWNSNDFTVPVAELALLDGDNDQHALNLITGKDPQNVIAHGEKKFRTLCVEWSHLETQRKGAA